ncbi:MAG: preprotein translocase subunit SecG, partial [Bdellovibrio sp.]
ALGMGGSSTSNSLLGATGAQSLASKMTVWSAVIFAITCLTLSILTASKSKSVVDSMPLPTAPVTAPAVPESAPAATTPATPEAAAPAASETK